MCLCICVQDGSLDQWLKIHELWVWMVHLSRLNALTWESCCSSNVLRCCCSTRVWVNTSWEQSRATSTLVKRERVREIKQRELGWGVHKWCAIVHAWHTVIQALLLHLKKSTYRWVSLIPMLLQGGMGMRLQKWLHHCSLTFARWWRQKALDFHSAASSALLAVCQQCTLPAFSGRNKKCKSMHHTWHTWHTLIQALLLHLHWNEHLQMS